MLAVQGLLRHILCCFATLPRSYWRAHPFFVTPFKRVAICAIRELFVWLPLSHHPLYAVRLNSTQPNIFNSRDPGTRWVFRDMFLVQRPKSVCSPISGRQTDRDRQSGWLVSLPSSLFCVSETIIRKEWHGGLNQSHAL